MAKANNNNKTKSKSNIGELISGLVLPGMFVAAWAFALSGTNAPMSSAVESTDINTIHWLLYFVGWVMLFSAVMHSLFAKKMAKSIGWVTNGFQYEIAAVSLGLGLGCFYAIGRSIEACVAIALPVITFLFFAGLNHLYEIIRDKNYAPNNSLVLIYDFGMSISLFVLILPYINF